MKRTLMLLVSAFACSVLAVTAHAMDRGDRLDRADRGALTAQQIVAESDAHTARIKADLRLTAEQEKNWPALASALHDIGESRAERQVAFQAKRAPQDDPEDMIVSLNQSASFLSEQSAELRKLADAAQPLYAGLDEHQKKRLFNALTRASSGRDN